MADFLDGIAFSEILADNPDVGSGGLDTNQDGTGNKLDEYVEFTNTTGATINLDGYQLWSGQNGLLHDFDDTQSIGPNEAIVVMGAPVVAGTPAGFVQANTNNDGAEGNGSSSGGFLEDGEGQKFDTLYLLNTTTGEYIQFTYGVSAVVPATPPFATNTDGLQGVGESISDNAGNTIAFVRDVNGDFVTDPDPTPGDPDPVCFVAGTMIATQEGPVAVEDLKPDMRLLTRDNGYLPLRAIRAADLTRAEMRWNADLAPIHIPEGLFGNTKPLVVSPAHRILVTGGYVEMVNGQSEALVAAHHLVGHAGVTRASTLVPVTYYHLLLDNHEILQSDGVWSESLFLGDVAHAAIRASEGWQISAECEIAAMTHPRTARVVLKRFEAEVLFAKDDSLINAVPHAA